MSDRLAHDAAWSAAQAILSIVAPCLRDEEQAEAVRMFYVEIKNAIQVYELAVDRQQQRLHGTSRN